MSAPSTGVIDASLVYGASRILRGVHKNPSGEYRGEHTEFDDQQLFVEFLHDILLYDRIVMDSSSMARIGQEISDITRRVNHCAGTQVLSTRNIATITSAALNQVAACVCGVIKDGVRSGMMTPDSLHEVPIPWAYQAPSHQDHTMVATTATAAQLDMRLIPYITFVYRGLCYAGFANNLAMQTEGSAAYIAAPGRVYALRRLISADDLRKLEYPKRGYRDLMHLLHLPTNGYDFTSLSFLPIQEVSSFALSLRDCTPLQALDNALGLRQSTQGSNLRKAWKDRLWARARSVVVGPSYTQTISNSTIGGDVYQVLAGAATD